MADISLKILGSGSAIPAHGRSQASHILSMHNKKFMIDCGEGTQVQMNKFGESGARLNHIFISHLHGDHCFGLLGLISSIGMRMERGDLYIHSHAELESVLRPALDFFTKGLEFNVYFEPFKANASECIYEDKSIVVTTIPLVHTMACSGFLFKEKPKERHLIRQKIDFFNVPIKELTSIKQGADFITPDGEVIPNSVLTKEASPSFSYAYCSDTAYSERIIPYIENVDLLFHESSYLTEHKSKAKKNLHSTAAQAATIAQKANVKKLILGHFSARYKDLIPFLEEAKPIFANTELTKDGAVFDY